MTVIPTERGPTRLHTLMHEGKPELARLYAEVHVPGSLLIKVHGDWYDVGWFAARHPGGLTALRIAAGRDATALFESSHVFADEKRVKAVLDRSRISKTEADRRGLKTLESALLDTGSRSDISPDIVTPVEGGFSQQDRNGGTDLPWVWDSPFRRTIVARVKDHFKREAARRGVSLIEATKATPEKVALMFVLAGLAIVSLVLLSRGNWAMIVIAPIACFLSGVNTFHDALHFSLSSNQKLNVFIGSLFPFFSAPITWYHQHVVGHHVHTNLEYHDPDLVHGTDLRREHKAHPHVPHQHNNQAHPFKVAFHFLVGSWLGLGLANDFQFMLTSPSQAYNGLVPRMPMHTHERALHILLRSVYILIKFLWPFFLLPAGTPVWQCLAFALGPLMIFSICFMLNTQINHLTPSAMRHTSRDWTIHQILTAQNFGNPEHGGPEWWFHFYFSGGLCLQMEHHVFPTVNHCHLPALTGILRATCDEFGVPYACVSGYTEGMRNYVQHTADLALGPPVDLVLKEVALSGKEAVSVKKAVQHGQAKDVMSSLWRRKSRAASVDLSNMLPLVVAPMVASLVEGKKEV
ncbi:fatty acid desaturase-domain-containing protein [Chytriomyces sp. MP71]|nr:fatty acid desaturase-domain-containing protein [Chytriomyces sp. MP71]